jgi:hypothetical protein
LCQPEKRPRVGATLDESRKFWFCGEKGGKKSVKDVRPCQKIDKRKDLATETQRAQKSDR